MCLLLLSGETAISNWTHKTAVKARFSVEDCQTLEHKSRNKYFSNISICELFGITLFSGWNNSCSTLNMFPIGKEGEFPCGSDSKESACNEGDPSSIPGSGWSIPWRKKRHSLQYSCLENSMYRGAWRLQSVGIPKSRTWLSDYTFTFSLENSMQWSRLILHS